MKGPAVVPAIGRLLARCMPHIGRAVRFTVSGTENANQGSARPPVKGLCAYPVLEGIRENTGAGNMMMVTASSALDGGVGLSGGMCGALAAALMVLGDEMGLDPRQAGVVETLRISSRGIPAWNPADERNLFTVGLPLVRRFGERFGSLECRDITGRYFEGPGDLGSHMEVSEECAQVRDWCRRECSVVLDRLRHC